ncbi:hypothetical protein C7S20_06495 [Christiangramia fulva]|uniref:Adhesin domain-containing protein n=1 Tax=Christiangramia fulva TaxID=2126553 RepID=A0A2R3Z3U6_9FLAO|nr:hypothetical protein [Christiangramia fulva]AVR44947.1 hypothetical protein C7S20_06495 [Christiangramia fulva]
MKKFFFIFLLFLGNAAIAQRNTQEKLDASNISSIRIESDEVFLVSVKTAPVSEISIRTHSEGEYFDNILLNSKVINGELVLSSEYPEILSGGYDKLSAHKVFSLEIEMEIPENMELNVTSNIASLVAEGNFKAVYANLKQGYCHLLDFSGAAAVNTYDGDILVKTNTGTIEASSRHGKVETPDFLAGRNLLKLTSIDGNIKVLMN